MKTNRDYFSYSQFALWESSRKAFYKRYALGVSYPPTKYQRFGSEVMKALEFDDFSKIPQARNIPKLDLIEDTVEVEVSIGNRKVKLMGIIDSASKGYVNIVDYKTGKHPWTQGMADSNEQLLFYAYIIYLRYGVIPKCSIIHLETYDREDGSVALTGNTYEYQRRNITVGQLNALGRRIKKAIIEIEEFEYIEVSIKPDLSYEYASLVLEKKRIDDRLDALKSEIMTEIIAKNTTYAETPEGIFTVANRKRWKYSKDIKEREDALKADKKEEERDGTATSSNSSYVTFKAKDY